MHLDTIFISYPSLGVNIKLQLFSKYNGHHDDKASYPSGFNTGATNESRWLGPSGNSTN
jgi:hypothetical protein